MTMSLYMYNIHMSLDLPESMNLIIFINIHNNNKKDKEKIL